MKEDSCKVHELAPTPDLTSALEKTATIEALLLEADSEEQRLRKQLAETTAALEHLRAAITHRHESLCGQMDSNAVLDSCPDPLCAALRINPVVRAESAVLLKKPLSAEPELKALVSLGEQP